MFRMQGIKLYLVKISMNHMNNYFFIEKLPIFGNFARNYPKNWLNFVNFSRLCPKIDSESTQSESADFDSLDSLRLTLEH